jgi:hypothetical protein
MMNNRANAPTKSTFSGVTVGVTDVLVKYTHCGDADLNGQVDGDDYFQIDNAFGNGGL